VLREWKLKTSGVLVCTKINLRFFKILGLEKVLETVMPYMECGEIRAEPSILQ